MPRLNAKTPSAEKDERLENINRIKRDHQRMKDQFDGIRRQRAKVLEFTQDPDVATILARFEEDAKSDAEALVMAEKKEIDGLQASVKARRSLLAQLKAAYEEDLLQAGERLRAFEIQNEMFLKAADNEEEAAPASKEA